MQYSRYGRPTWGLCCRYAFLSPVPIAFFIFILNICTGSAISWDGHFNAQVENEVFSAVIDLVLNCAAFIYIGAWMPFSQFNIPELGIAPWKLVVLFLSILVLRRIPCMLVLYKWIPEITTWREALFSGHFGKSPSGLGLPVTET